MYKSQERGERTMLIPIIQTSDYCRSLLQKDSIGNIHSVYRKTINLQLAGHLFALQDCQSVLSPVSLITSLSAEEINHLGVRTDMDVKISSGAITIPQISDLSFSFSDSVTQDLRLAPTSKEPGVLIPLIQSSLDLSEGNGFSEIFRSSAGSDCLSDPVLKHAKHQINLCNSCLLEGRNEAAAEALRKMVGLGIGLTPSGDDFLCGVLAGLRLYGRESSPFSANLQKELQSHLMDTNDISRTFLVCALQGQFSLPVIRLTAKKQPLDILEEFSQIGHTSGLDTLCGLLYAISTCI